MSKVAVNLDTVGGIPTLALTQFFVHINGLGVILKSPLDFAGSPAINMSTASTQSFCTINGLPIVVFGDLATDLMPIIASSFVNIS